LILRKNARLFAYKTSPSGETGTESFRINFSSADEVSLSPWHNIPLKDGDFFNFINEIPKYTKAKMEVATKEKFNPIAQDIKKGKLRDYHGPIFWNYGCLPQTWEDPNVLHPVVNCKGDNDPVDVVEIGTKALASGSISKVLSFTFCVVLNYIIIKIIYCTFFI
jgi:inorganic pyrophosphatase